MKFIIKYRKIIIFLIILALGIFFRFYNLRKNVEFGWDQESAIIQIKTMIDNKKPLLIGPRIGPAKFFLPPLYYYLNAPFLLLTKFDPIGLYYCSALLGIITSLLIHLYTSKIYNHKTAFVAFTLYLFSPLMIVYDRVPWNINLIIIATYTCYLALLNIANDEKNKISNYFVLGVALGIAINAHFTAIFLMVISILWLALKRKLSFYLFISIFIIILFVLPLIVFDLRHNFFNYNAAMEFFRGNKELLPITPSLMTTRFIKNIFISLELFGSFLVGKINFWGKFALGFAGIIYFCFRLIKTAGQEKHAYQLGSLFLIIPSFLFTYYHGDKPEYYFFFLFPIFILFSANFLAKLIDYRVYSISMIISFSIFWAFLIHDFDIIKAETSDGLYYKQQVTNYIKDSPIKITYLMPSGGQGNGYAYFLNLKKIIIDNNAKTEVLIKFPVLEDVRQSDYKVFGNIGVKLKEPDYDSNFQDYFDSEHRYAFDLLKNLTVIKCLSQDGYSIYTIADAVNGSCLYPTLKDDKVIKIMVSDELNIQKYYNQYLLQSSNNEFIYYPERKTNSILIILTDGLNNPIIRKQFDLIKTSLKMYHV